MDREERDKRICDVADKLYADDGVPWQDRGQQLFALELVQIHLGIGSSNHISEMRDKAHDHVMAEIKRLRNNVA